MTPRKPPEVFLCQPIPGAKLTRAACGKRWTSYRTPSPGRVKAACVSCSVGALHARNRRPSVWPDGSPIVTLRLNPRGLSKITWKGGFA